MKIDCITALLLTAALSVLGTGCSTSNPASSTKARPIANKDKPFPDLKPYTVATVVPFPVLKPQGVDRSVGGRFAEEIARRLKYDFGTLFEQVTVGEPTGATNELVVTGEITFYQPGNRALRGVLIGLGAASLNGNFMLKTNKTEIFRASFERLWAWGGWAGMSRGIEEMETETTASIANAVARGKGWKPPEKK